MVLTKENILRAIVFVVVIAGLGAITGYAAGSGNDWYESLKKSPLTPPNWVFPVAWTSIYTLMGLAGAWLYREHKRVTWKLFLLQLVMNYAWSFIFFTFHEVAFAFVWILLLIFVVLAWLRVLWKINKTVTLMQVPYVLWMCFAAYLTWEILRLN